MIYAILCSIPMLAMIFTHWQSRDILSANPGLMPDTGLRNDRRWDMLASIAECVGWLILMWWMVFYMHHTDAVTAFLMHVVVILGAWARAYGSVREWRRLKGLASI